MSIMQLPLLLMFVVFSMPIVLMSCIISSVEKRAWEMKHEDKRSCL
jgi:hypothetical protein